MRSLCRAGRGAWTAKTDTRSASPSNLTEKKPRSEISREKKTRSATNVLLKKLIVTLAFHWSVNNPEVKNHREQHKDTSVVNAVGGNSSAVVVQ